MQATQLDSDFLNYLVNNDIQVGDSLPTLAEISEQMGVSVGKLREEVACARAEGIVSIKPRKGMRREPFSFLSVILPSIKFGLTTGDTTFEQLSQLRIGIELGLWHKAVSVLDAQDVAALYGYIEQARAKLDIGKIPHEEHRAFHLGIFGRIQNPFVTGILEAYWEVYAASEFNSYRPFSYWQEVWHYHERILNAIQTNKYEQARQLLIEHFNLLKTTPIPASQNGSSSEAKQPK